MRMQEAYEPDKLMTKIKAHKDYAKAYDGRQDGSYIMSSIQ
jgi:hypothetical protein